MMAQPDREQVGMLPVCYLRPMLRCAGILALLISTCLSQQLTDPWPARDLLQPSALAQALRSAKPPIVLSIGFPVLYRSKHILHAIEAGPASKPEGIEALKKALANVPKNSDIVIYCGCCPMDKCPNT
jgi:thiosulfate/3-mercaptopyruvate sulfurtransferase